MSEIHEDLDSIKRIFLTILDQYGLVLLPCPVEDKVGGWLAFRKEPITDSFAKNFEFQRKLVPVHERIPTLAELDYFLKSYQIANDIHLLSDCFVRVEDIDEEGEHFIAGYFSKEGLKICPSFDSNALENIGIITVRDFS